MSQSTMSVDVKNGILKPLFTFFEIELLNKLTSDPKTLYRSCMLIPYLHLLLNRREIGSSFDGRLAR